MTPKYLVSEDRVIGTLFTKISQSCLNLYDKQLLRISDLSFHISHIVHRRAPSSISECHLILSSTSSSEMTHFLISLLGPPSLSPSLLPHLNHHSNYPPVYISCGHDHTTEVDASSFSLLSTILASSLMLSFDTFSFQFTL